MEKSNNKTKLKLAFFLNLGFTIFEVFGGLLTNSVAIISDSIHDFGDCISIGLAWFLEKYSRHKPNSKYTYGYARYSLLGALITSFVLFVGSFIIVMQGIPRIINPQPVDSVLMIIFAIIGILVNGGASLYANRGKSLNEKAISLHLFEDSLGWVAVLISAIAMSIWNIMILDGILSICFAIYILYHAFKNIVSVFKVLLQKCPDNFDIEELKIELLKTKHVLDVNHIHIWSLEGNYTLATIHVLIEKGLQEKEIIQTKSNLHSALKTLGIEHTTIELEFFNCKDTNAILADTENNLIAIDCYDSEFPDHHYKTDILPNKAN